MWKKLAGAKFEKMFWLFNLVVLFLYAVDIFGFPNKIAIVWIGIAGLYYIWRRKAVSLDLKTVLLTIGMFSYAALFKYHNPEWNITLILSFGIVPVLFYLMGRQLVGITANNPNYARKAELSVVAISFGMFIHAILNYTVWMKGEVINKRWPDFWPDNFADIATEHSFLSVVAAALLAYGIYYLTKKWYYGLVVILCAFIGNYINIKMDNRMVLVITVLILFVNFLIYLYLNRNDRKMLFRVSAIVCILILLAGIFWVCNIGDIQNNIYVQHLITRNGGIIHNVRFEVHAKAASQLLSNWKGGANMELGTLGHTHNYWLEMANQVGLIPFIPTVIFTVMSLVDVIRLVLNDAVSDGIKYILPSALISVFLYLYVEVGGIGTPDYWVFFTVLAGIVSQAVKCAGTGRLKDGKKEN